jgi:hypothetical protein
VRRIGLGSSDGPDGPSRLGAADQIASAILRLASMNLKLRGPTFVVDGGRAAA